MVKSRRAALEWDKMFGEGERVDETHYCSDSSGNRYVIRIYEDSEPGTYGQANFSYSIRSVDTYEWIADHDYIMAMSRVWELIQEDLDKNGLVLEAGKGAMRKADRGDELQAVLNEYIEDCYPNDMAIEAVGDFLDWLYMTGKRATRKRASGTGMFDANGREVQIGDCIIDHYSLTLGSGSVLRVDDVEYDGYGYVLVVTPLEGDHAGREEEVTDVELSREYFVCDENRNLL